MIDISVIISVYKNNHLLEQLIRKLLKQLSNKGEIIVVADEPDQETLIILKEHDSVIKYFINKKKKGKLYALNFGTKKAIGSNLLFLDIDKKIGDDYFVEKVIEEINNQSLLDVKNKGHN